MSLVVFRSLLQRPKDVVFEGLSEGSLVMEVEKEEEDEEEEERMQREVGEFGSKRENDMTQNENWMSVCVVVVGINLKG